jgi:mannose-6-phosphate isomerase
MTPTVVALENPIQGYAWGSKTVISSFLGRGPAEAPEAELWIGAHPKAPSRIEGADPAVTLDVFIGGAPAATLGPAVAQHFGAELPFLLKLIAAAEPLSIQCHPNLEQARDGFARENRLGIPLEAFERNYRDPNHKPELVVAFTRFTALLGFRPPDELLRLLRPLAIEALDDLLDGIENGPPAVALRAFFSGLLGMDVQTRTRALAFAARRAEDHSADNPAYAWVARLIASYPTDIGALSPLFLNLVELAPEEGIFVRAGELHAHLEGAAIEIMASSDNVLRGGLTPKHVDVKELLRTAYFEPGPPEVLRPLPMAPGERVYLTPAREFELGLLDVSAGAAYPAPPGRGVELLLGLEGDASLRADGRTWSLARGRSAFVPAAVKAYTIEGVGRIARASVPRT